MPKGPWCKDHWAEHQWKGKGSAAARGYDKEHEIRKARILRQRPFCVVCQNERRVVLATVLDHITPKAEGGTDDDSNLQGLCQYHSDQKTKQEARRGMTRATIARTREHVLVYGPPCGGKRDFVARCRQPGDIVFDADALWAHLTGYTLDATETNMKVASAVRGALVRLAKEAPTSITLWVIATAPTPDDRARVMDDLRHARRLVMPTIDDCISRAAHHPRAKDITQSIHDWFDRYLRD